jgi:SAM-dependent methyltransferase
METVQPYDLIAQQYKDSKTLPFRTFIEAYTLFRLLGPLAGQKVLDLACGEGFYTRKLKQGGAAYVLGLDISPGMIALAEAEEARAPLGCTYRVADVTSVGHLDDFDVVVAAYLLNYARTKDELLAFCRAIHANLKPGGRFVGFNDNVANAPARYGSYVRYGFIKASPPGRTEGDPITYTLFNPDGTTFHFDNYYLSPATYEAAFHEAGFRRFAWRGPWLDEHARTAFPAGYWDDFFADPPLVGLEAVK